MQNASHNQLHQLTIVWQREGVADLFEVGDAGEIIQTPKFAMIDEVAGSDGPNQYSLEDE